MRENMSDEQPTIEELLEKRDSLLLLKEAIEKRIANISEVEKLEVLALSNRATHPQCSFDRKHSKMLYLLALMPDRVSWYFKLREKIHRLAHHH
jgi:hypothetical protein